MVILFAGSVSEIEPLNERHVAYNAYFPCQLGARFSINAFIPSFWSSVAKSK
jgi:hypothetical protein